MTPAGAVCILVVMVFASAGGVIWGPPTKEPRQDSPQVISLDQAAFSEPVSDHDRRRLFTRDVGTDSIGHTTALSGDRHVLALVHWTGHPSQFLFILTRNRGISSPSSESWLWRSRDYGHTFVNETFKWNSNTVIEWYYISPFTEYLIFSDRINRMLWVTRDEGMTYSSHQLSFRPRNFRFQSVSTPNSDSLLLAEYVLGYDSSGNGSLWVSTDLGSNWIMLSSGVVSNRYFWRVLDSTMESNTTVYYEKAVNATHSRLYMTQYPYTEQRLFPGLSVFTRNTFYLSNEYMFVQLSASNRSSNQYKSPLWVSRNRGPFRQARFPLHFLDEKHYSVVDTSEGEVFIAVYHDINNTNLYLSEEAGLNYTQSLSNVVSASERDWVNGNPHFDVHVAEGIVGTYIANIKSPTTNSGSTVISFDKGGTWLQLSPPYADFTCQKPSCSLHLHVQSENGLQSILTQDSAIGLIMAQGNLGAALTNNIFQVRLYSSRDGGFTWMQVDAGRKQFQFAGLGSVVVWVDQRRTASYVDWSCDEAQTEEKVSFLTNSDLDMITVVGMLTEKGEKARHVTVFGYVGAFEQWLVVDLNFTSVVSRQCQNSSYIRWIPTDERPGSRCLLGDIIQYERRNASVCCYTDPNRQLVISRTPCTCTREDFECDFGFERVELNSPCTPLQNFQWPPLQPADCPLGSFYNVSSGYRKVAGDKCIPGTEMYFFPIKHPCIIDNKYVSVDEEVQFVVSSVIGSGLVIPDQAIFTWHIITPRPEPCHGYEIVLNRSNTYTTRFSCWGDYDITVSGNISASPFTLRIQLTAEYVLGPIVLNRTLIPAVLRSGAPLTLQVIPKTNRGVSYKGALNMLVSSINGSLLGSMSQVQSGTNNISGEVHLIRDSLAKAAKPLNISLQNHVSSISLIHIVILAVSGEYAELRLHFKETDLPNSIESDPVLEDLQVAVKAMLLVLLKNIPNASVEIEAISLSNNSPSSSPSELRRRQGQGDSTEIMVDVNLLPASLNHMDIIAIKNASDDLLKGGYLVVVLHGTSLNASVSVRTQVPTPAPAKVITDFGHYLELGTALGAGLAFILLLAVALSIAVYFYRRKYHRLNVRYSRLRQTPVRFTFTQGGELVEDEEYENEEDDEPLPMGN